MEWQTGDDGLWHLVTYDGTFEVARLIITGNDGQAPIFELHSQFLSGGFEILAADTEDEAKAEAVSVLKDAIEAERDDLNEILRLFGEQEAQP